MKPQPPRLIFCLKLLFFLTLTAWTASGANRTLVVTVDGTGTVLKNPNLPEYPNGANVTLTAQPANGWRFVKWSQDASGSVNPLDIILDSDKAVRAQFEQIPVYEVTFAVPSGGGSLDRTSGTHPENTALRITATPDTGWVFGGWRGSVQSTENPLDFVVRSNSALIADFFRLPRITRHPASLSVPAGSRAEFSVDVEGDGSLTYQWFHDGEGIPAANSRTLVIPNAQTGNEGQYRVTVQSPYGTVQSQPATLRIESACPPVGGLEVCDEASLRAAVEQGGYIRFCCNGTILLQEPLLVQKPVILDASGKRVALDGGGRTRLVQVASGIRFAATNLTFQNGYHLGSPGVDGEGLAVVIRPHVPGGHGEGGAILNEGGDLVLAQCSFHRNRAQGGMASLVPGPGNYKGDPGHGQGGAILSRGGSLHIEDSRFTENTCKDGAVPENHPVSTIYSLAFPRFGRGGAICILGPASAHLKNVVFQKNLAAVHPRAQGIAQGGSLSFNNVVASLQSCLVSDSTAAADQALLPGLINLATPTAAEGGAVHVIGGELFIRNSTLRNNTAQGSMASRHSGTGSGSGGGIFSSGHCRIESSTLHGNQALAGSLSSRNTNGMGGGIFNQGTLTLVNSTLSLNRAAGGSASIFGTPVPNYPGGDGFGGGIYNMGVVATTNSTLSGNKSEAGAPAGGRAGNAYGGGLYNRSGSATLVAVTLAANAAVPATLPAGPSRPGITLGDSLANSLGSISLLNTLVAGSGTNGHGFGTILDAGYNMCSDASLAFNSGTSFNRTDPRLQPLANNGGPTQTHMPDRESPALNFGALAGVPAWDQRGTARPSGPRIDIGAVESDPVSDRPWLLVQQISPEQVSISFQPHAQTAFALWASANLVAWQRVENPQVMISETAYTFLVDPRSSGWRFFQVRTE